MAASVHLWLVAYDIRSDRVRNRIADVLEGWGERVQYSVFECRLREADAQKLSQRLKKVLRSKENGSVRMYRVCDRCVKKSVGFGDVASADDQAAIVR